MSPHTAPVPMSSAPDPPAAVAARGSSAAPRAGYGSVLALTSLLVIAVLLTLMAAGLLVVHPDDAHLSVLAAKLVNQQNQSVKTALYVVGFFVLLPLALIGVPRLADRIARGPGGAGLPALVASLTGLLAAILIVVRVSDGFGLGDGVKGVLVGMAVWWIVAAGALLVVLSSRRSGALGRLGRAGPAPYVIAALLVFGLLVCLTSSGSLGAVPLVIGAIVACAVIIAAERVEIPRLGRARWLFDFVLVVVVILAVPDTIIFKSSTAIPSVYYDPGVVQFQHDWILGSANQLLRGGALLVNVPVSQYGVGLIYFLDGWFHLAPIGYGTFGFLDGVLSALFYVAAYAVMRITGVRRLLAGAAVLLGVLTFAYNFQFFVGQLPEEGPLRFGLPMLVLLGTVAGARWPRHAAWGRALMLLALGVAAIWALEAFAYTTFTFAAIAVVAAWLAPAGARRRSLMISLRDGVAAIVVAHVLLALATLLGTGELPHWHQYLGYVQEFLFGDAGSITYGFANWSPGLAVFAAALVSAAAIVLLMVRRPDVARRDPALLLGLTGSTAYAIAILSYTDNRSSTYLFLYVAVPLLIAAVLWISLTRTSVGPVAVSVRRWVLASSLAVCVLLFAGAWPAIGEHFSRSVLAHAYPGGGLRTRLSRLWHPPPIDPRAPAGVRLLDRYVPGSHPLVLLPTTSDLGLEILMRSHRANALPMGDPKADSLVPSVWLPTMRAAVPHLRAGRRMLIDRAALQVIAAERNPAVDPATARIQGGQPEIEWILHELDQRFRIQVLHTDPATGLIVAQLAPRNS